mmetsp:Transcript_50517/g.108228  ORF Transcript_50517/g.108228 Transcript_50517/m.108228 type:complete len:534 (-) Transcript_50517:155-1756(-)
MILDNCYSEIGRSTSQQLDALRRQLGVGIDPAFDYSAMEEMQKQLSKKKEKKRPGNEDGASQDSFGPMSGLDQLRRALRDKVGGGAGADGEPGASDEADGASPSGQGPKQVQMEAHKKRNGKPSAAFCSTSRDDLKKLDINNRFRAPPIGTYRPEEHLTRPRLKGSDFGLKDATKSRKQIELEKEVARLQAENEPWEHLVKPVRSVELLDEVPERMKNRLRESNMAKDLERPDLVKAAGIHFQDNSFTAGVLDGDLQCSHLTRKPKWDFAKLSVSKPKDRETYFQPGRYNVNIGAVKPTADRRNIPFGKQQGHKPLKEMIGRIEINGRAGDHLPDRSLSRSCPLLSSQPRLLIPDLEKYSERPPIVRPNLGEYHDKKDPDIDASVMHGKMTYDAMETTKVLWRKSLTVEDFNKSLKREQQLKVTRTYGEDIPMQRAKDNITRGPVSVELMSDIDQKPQLKPRIKHNIDFGLMAHYRETEKHFMEKPPRFQDLSGSAKFERSVRPGEARSEAHVLSPIASGISKVRATRSYDEL